MINKPVSFFGAQGGGIDYTIDEDTFDFVLAPLLVGPLEAREYVVLISNALVGSTDPATPAFDTGVLPGGASVRIIGAGMAARIQGAGGAGGDGGRNDVIFFVEIVGNIGWAIYGGGGGGGQGANPGAGGAILGGSASSPGDAGTRNAPGVGGATVNNVESSNGADEPASNGSAGGTGVFARVDVTIEDIAVWGGGGGGAGGNSTGEDSNLEPGGTGGAKGAAGDSNSYASGGAAGAAIDMNGNTLTQEGTNDVQGAII